MCFLGDVHTGLLAVQNRPLPPSTQRDEATGLVEGFFEGGELVYGGTHCIDEFALDPCIGLGLVWLGAMKSPAPSLNDEPAFVLTNDGLIGAGEDFFGTCPEFRHGVQDFQLQVVKALVFLPNWV